MLLTGFDVFAMLAVPVMLVKEFTTENRLRKLFLKEHTVQMKCSFLYRSTVLYEYYKKLVICSNNSENCAQVHCKKINKNKFIFPLRFFVLFPDKISKYSYIKKDK